MFIVPLGDDLDHRQFPLVGTLLVAANVIVFICMIRLAMDAHSAAGAQREMVQFVRHWGLVPAVLAQGKPLGLLTYMFLHGGLLHLVGNMFFLWAFMYSLEYSLGGLRFLVLYVLWGIAAGLAHAALNWHSDMPMVGASGAIAGMIGAYWIAFGSFTKIRTGIFIGLSCVKFDVPAAAYIVVWVLLQLLGASMAKDHHESIAWYAHFGGFAAGAVTMAFYKRRIHSRLVVGDGYVGLRDAPAKTAAVEIAEPQPEAVPSVCPYCNRPLDDALRLAPTLLRCGNPACGRCIYLEGMAAS